MLENKNMKKIKEIFVNVKKAFNKHSIINMVLVFLAFSLVFVSGFFSDDINLEKSADYVTQLANDSRGNLLGVSVESKTKSIPSDAHSEFHNVYGLFSERIIYYSMVANPTKDEIIEIKDIGTSSLSVLYFGPIGTVEYDGHYKHYIYPIELMFQDQRFWEINPYSIYISKSQANLLLNKRGYNSAEYSSEEYKSLVGTEIILTVNNEEKNYIIQNVYYETNYYYDGLNDVVGDFVIISYYLHGDIKFRNIYYMGKYESHNKYLLNYIQKNFSKDEYVLGVVGNNLEYSVDEKIAFSFFQDNNSVKSFLSVFILIISFAILVIVLFFKRKKRGNEEKTHISLIEYTLLVLSALVPYFISKFLYFLTGNISFFTDFSAKINVVFLLLFFLFLYLATFVFKKNIGDTLFKREGSNEVTI